MTTRYYKATRPDLTDFRTGTVRYEIGTVVTHPVKKRVKNDPSTYLSVSTVPTDCTGMEWPCRLLVVEGIGRPMLATNLPNKRAFTSVRVIEELPAWQVFGPHGEQVVKILDRARTLTRDEVRRLRVAWAAVGDAAWATAWAAVGDAAGATAWAAVGDAAWATAWDAAWATAWDAARAAARAATLAWLVSDFISDEHFDALTKPWREVIGD